MFRSPFFATIILFCFSLVSFAGTTGKISGKVTDAASGAPLPGVNVLIQGTQLGAATSLDGHYVILNVPPGMHTLKFTMMGYAIQVIKDVRVVIDLTTTINAELKQEALIGEEVVVVAERPVVQKDVSNSQMNIEAQTIEFLPVQTVDKVLTLQAGIQTGREGILIRGGSANQTLFTLDGLSMNDERSNIPYSSVSLSSVSEIQIQTGGFNAEYGNVRSGIINVVTKEGSRDRYTATATFHYSPPAQKHFGPSIYSPNSYFNRPYMDPAVCWTGTDNGNWDSYTKRQYPHFEGWKAVSQKTLSDADPNNDLTPEGAKRLYEWQHRRTGDIGKADYVVDAAVGGPVPLIGNKLGNLRFFLSYFRDRDMFIFPLSRDHYGSNHTQLKLTSDLSKSMKLVFNSLYGETYSVSPYSWKTTPTGWIIKTPEQVANLLNSSSGNAVLYMPGFYSPSDIYRTAFSLKFTHVLSSKTFYETSLQYKSSRYNTYKMTDRDLTPKYEPVPGYKVDEAPYGYYGYSVSGIDGMILGGWMNLGRDKSVNSTTTFRFDMTSQINTANQLKTGLEVVYNDYDIKSSTESPSMSTWTRKMVYNIFPYRIGAYVFDKLEYEGFIANLSARLDYSDPNTDWYHLNEYDKYFRAGYGKSIETQVDRIKAEPNWNFSPRLGISHPITDNSKLYFNYGHYLSEARSSYRFRLQRESNGLVTYIGDPNLLMEKTVAYELGFSQNILDMFLLNVAAYYKDVSNQPGWIFYQNINNSVQYYKASNNNYQDIRGFEITLTKQLGRWLSGFVNYTYDVKTSGYFGLTHYYEDPNLQRDYLRLNPYQSKPRPQPFARANINLHTPVEFGQKWMGIYPFGNWNLNFLSEWRTGSYYTYNPNNIPGIVDDTQWKDYFNLDLRLSKSLKLSGFQFIFYVDVRNALNTKRLAYEAFSDNYDWLDYLQSLNFPWETGVEHGNDRIGEYRPDGVEYDPLVPNPDNDPVIKAANDERKRKKSYIDMPNFKSLTFLNPRDIILGLKINF